MRQNGHGTVTLEDARTWIEETGLCLFLPRRQFSSSIAPSFVEATAGKHDATPDPKHIALAEELLVRLEADGVAVRLNLLGQPGEQPDFVVASWVLPYVYALRGDRDWRRSPQLTGSRQVSQLAIQAYKLLEAGDSTIASLKHALGREVTEVAVLRAITELWQQLRIIPVIAAAGQPAQWQLLRTRYQKAIAEGASTSQVTAISVLASIYLQAVIAASMEEVELFLAPLTARSKVREVLRGLVATRQVHTISLGHAPHFYVAGTLPEFATVPTLYASSSMASSAYFLRGLDHEEDAPGEIEAPVAEPISAGSANLSMTAGAAVAPKPSLSPKPINKHEASSNGNSPAARSQLSRPPAHSRDRKPAQTFSNRTGSRPSTRTSARPPARRTTPAEARPAATRPAGGLWKPKAATGIKGSRNGAQAGSGSTNGARNNGASRSDGNSTHRNNGASGAGTGKSAKAAWGQRNGHSNGNGAESAGKPTAAGRNGSSLRGGSTTRTSSTPRKDARTAARPARNNRKPAMAAGTKAGNSKRYGFTARPKRETKKRG
ncbi:MAG: hypothetical protein ABSG51_01410 [Terracidiphilus sp.]|jgi:hypothetical protein